MEGIASGRIKLMPPVSQTGPDTKVAAGSLPARMVACHDCDALFEARELHEGETMVCTRCAAKLESFRPNSVNRSAALAMSAAFLFFVANFFPFLELKAGAQGSRIVLAQSVSELQAQGSPWLAGAVAVFILAAPATTMCGMLYVLLPLLGGRILPGAIHVCRWVYGTDPWNMIEVFLISVLVSILKLADIATVTLGVAFWAFIGLILCLTASLASIDRRDLWERLEAAGR